MGCQGCGPAPPALPTDGRIFSCPLNGAAIEIVVRGTVTAKNLPLVKQYLSFVYDVLTPEGAES